MPEPDWTLRIASIQRKADKAVRGAAIEIEKLDGQRAVEGYLNKSLCNLLAVAIIEMGPQRARQLIVGGLQTVDEYTRQEAHG